MYSYKLNKYHTKLATTVKHKNMHNNKTMLYKYSIKIIIDIDIDI